MKMYVPEIGDKITLTKDWTFLLFDEYRNGSLFDLLRVKCRGRWIERESDGKKFFANTDMRVWVADDNEEMPVVDYFDIRSGRVPGLTIVEDQGTTVTLKAGQRLSIDRVYIRKGASDFSSITFNYIGAPRGSGRVRFWAKLSDVNNIEFEHEKV